MGRKVAAAAVLLGAALLLWWVLGDWGTGPAGLPLAPGGGGARDGELSASGRPMETCKGPSLEGAPVKPHVSRGAPVAGSYLVQGLVLRPDGTGAAGATVRAWAYGLDFSNREKAQHGTADASGHYELDVTSFFQPPALPLELEIEARDGVSRPASKRIHVGGHSRVAGGDLWQADLRLERGVPVTGRLLDPDGRPLPSGRVRLYEMHRGRPFQPRGLPAGVATQSDGSFAIVAPASGSYLLLCMARDLAPTAIELELGGGTATALGDVQLGEGAGLKGRLRINGQPAAGVALSVSCAASSTRPLKFEPWRNDGALWREDGVFTASARTKTDEEGGFALRGLAEERHRIQIGRSKTFLIHPDVWRPIGWDAHPPDEEVEIDLKGVWVDALVLGADGLPLAGARCSVGLTALRTDAEGRMRLLVPENPSVTFGVSAPGLRPVWGKVTKDTLGRKGPLTVSLAPSKASASKASLRLVLAGPGAESVDLVGVGLYRRSPALNPYYMHSPEHDYTVRRSGRAFVVNGAPQGVWDVVVCPGGSWEGGEGHFLPIENKLDVPASGVLKQVIGLVPAGRLRIQVRTQDGALHPARCRVVNAAGQDVPICFYARSGGQSATARSLSVLGPSTVHPALPAGAYTLHIKGTGIEAVQRKVEVVAGRTVDVDVVLPRN